jgi:hypothetical protein
MLERLIAYVLVMGAIVWIASELAAPEVAPEDAGPPEAPEPARDDARAAPPPPEPEKGERRGLLGLPLL